MTTRRAAKKAGKELAQIVVEAEVVDDGLESDIVPPAVHAEDVELSWEVKLRDALLTCRPGIIYAQLTAWEADNPALQEQHGRDETFRFDPVLTAARARAVTAARSRALQSKLNLKLGEWPLYGGQEGSRHVSDRGLPAGKE